MSSQARRVRSMSRSSPVRQGPQRGLCEHKGKGKTLILLQPPGHRCSRGTADTLPAASRLIRQVHRFLLPAPLLEEALDPVPGGPEGLGSPRRLPPAARLCTGRSSVDPGRP